MASSSKLVLVTGGTRSGKSDYALSLERPGMRKTFVATCEPLDEEIRARIECHRRARPSDWLTVEEPVEVDLRLQLLADQCDLVVVDCLTLWVTNLIMRGMEVDEVLRRTDRMLATARLVNGTVVFVTNEVGMGIVPADPLARSFQDLAGTVNQRVAREADEVYFLVAGLPMEVKRP